MFWKIEGINLDCIEEDVNYINVCTNKTPIQIWTLKLFLTSCFIVVSNNFLQVLIIFNLFIKSNSMFNMLGFVLNSSYIHPNTFMECYDFLYFHFLVGLFYLISMYIFLIVFNNVSFCLLFHSLLFSQSCFCQIQHCIKMMANKFFNIL